MPLIKVVGYTVVVDWSQTEKDKIFVWGAKSKEEAVKAVKDKGYNCPRISASASIQSIIDIRE